MKLLVCISQTPDTTAKISFTPDGKEFNAAGVQFIMNPYDEWYALVRACELKETLGGTVVAINVGPAANDKTIRKALAIGADEAVRIDADPKSAGFVAKQIAEYARNEQFDIIFFGKETIDFNGSEVGAMTAEYLDLPYVSYGSQLDIAGNVATLSREIEGGVEVLEVNTPFVVSAARHGRTTHSQHAGHHGRQYQTAQSGSGGSVPRKTWSRSSLPCLRPKPVSNCFNPTRWTNLSDCCTKKRKSFKRG